MATSRPESSASPRPPGGTSPPWEARSFRAIIDKWQLGAEIAGAVTSNADLNRGQLQFVVGASYEIRMNFNVDVGFIAGHFAGSPREGIQVGFSVDLPRDSPP